MASILVHLTHGPEHPTRAAQLERGDIMTDPSRGVGVYRGADPCAAYAADLARAQRFLKGVESELAKTPMRQLQRQMVDGTKALQKERELLQKLERDPSKNAAAIEKKKAHIATLEQQKAELRREIEKETKNNQGLSSELTHAQATIKTATAALEDCKKKNGPPR